MKIRIGRKAVAVCAIASLGVLGALSPSIEPAHADTVGPIDFESFALGSPNGQSGWSATGSAGSGCALYDHAVVNNALIPGAPVSFGTKSLRISNAVTSGCFGDQTFSTSTANEAGESGANALNAGMSGGIRQNRFHSEFKLASVTPGAEQPGLIMSTSPDRGDGARMSYLRFEDSPAGINVFFDDFQDLAPFGSIGTPADGCDINDDFVETQIATVSRSAHTFAFDMKFVDGPRNDSVKISIDGVAVHTGGSWEDYFRYCEGPALPSRTVDSMLFRTGGGAVPGNAGAGFLIDGVKVTTQIPSTVVIGPNNLAPNGAWAVDPTITNPGVIGFSTGPATPPSGTGSLHMTIASGQHAWLNSYAYGACNNSPTCAVPAASWTALNTIDELSYSTYRVSGTSKPTVDIQIAPGGTAALGDYTALVFIPDAGTFTTGSWQTWDTMNPSAGTWYSTRNLGVAPFNCAAMTCGATWNQIQTSSWFNTAKIKGGIGVQVGTDTAFDGNVDAFTLGISGSPVVFDFEATGSPGLPVISTQNVTVSEGNALNTITVPVALSKASSSTVTVAYVTRTGSANLADFGATSGTLVFTPGQTVNFIPVNIFGNGTAERYEKFYVDLKYPTNATLLGAAPKLISTVTLQNDDLPKLIMTNRIIGEVGNTPIGVKINFPYNQNIVVNLSSANFTAVAPGDYDALVGTTVTFPAGTTTQQFFIVNVKADSVTEFAEKFNVTATPPPGMTGKTISVSIPANAT